MKRIYLDQNKWIDLVGAEQGAEKAARYQDVLILARAGVQHGLASFPLSFIHYIETANRKDWQSRQALAATMASLSRFHSIAPVPALVPPEIDSALRQFFGVPLVPRQAQVFGTGVAHAFDRPFQTYRVPKDANVDPGFKYAFEQWASEVWEWTALAGFPPEAGVDESEIDAWQAEVNARLAEEQERYRQIRREGRWHVGERARRLARASAFAGWKDELTEALDRAGLQWSHVFSLGQDGMSDFIEHLPIVHVASELQRQREAAADKPWDPHDVNDVFFLMGALVYCDIVVTERQWEDLIKRSGLDERYQTLVLSDLVRLAPHLASP